MPAQMMLALVLLASPLGILTLHAILTRIVRSRGHSIAPQLLAVSSVLLGHVPVLWLAWRLALHNLCSNRADLFAGVIFVFLTYNALAFCYVCLFNVSETSLHVHILTIVFQHELPVGELAERYNAAEMIKTRIDRMISLGQLTEKDGYFVLTGNTVLLL